MGLETLLEAAKYLEYRAEVEARGEKGDLPSNGSSSAISPSPTVIQNGYANHNNAVIPNGLHYASQPQFKTSPINNSAGFPRVPEPLNGFKISDHSYRRMNQNHSPTFDFNGGTNRMSKTTNGNGNANGNGNNTLNNRNSGTREVHNKLEKNRRAHLKECFELLKSQLPAFEDRKISNLAILRSSLRHIQTLKRKEREYEHEMERLAREKISLQQRLSTLKKDMLGKWEPEHLDWRGAPEDQGLECDGNGFGTDTLSTEYHPLDYHQSPEENESNSPANLAQPPKIELKPDLSDTQHPLSVTINNCHLGEKFETVKKLYGQINGVNGISGTGPISLVTASKLSSSPLAAITVEKTASSPIGGATFNGTTHNSGKGFSVLSSTALPVHNVGQYYDEKMCK